MAEGTVARKQNHVSENTLLATIFEYRLLISFLFHCCINTTRLSLSSAMTGRFFAGVKLSSSSKVAQEKLALVKPL